MTIGKTVDFGSLSPEVQTFLQDLLASAELEQMGEVTLNELRSQYGGKLALEKKELILSAVKLHHQKTFAGYTKQEAIAILISLVMCQLQDVPKTEAEDAPSHSVPQQQEV